MNNKETKLIIESEVAKIQEKKKISNFNLNDLSDPALIEYGLWSFGFLLNELFSDNDISPKIKDLYHNSLLFCEYRYHPSKKISNLKILELIENLMGINMKD